MLFYASPILSSEKDYRSRHNRLNIKYECSVRYLGDIPETGTDPPNEEVVFLGPFN